MPKPNYSFEKRQRELAKKRKKEDKAARKAQPRGEEPEAAGMDASGVQAEHAAEASSPAMDGTSSGGDQAADPAAAPAASGAPR